jgi:hypothetical protein
MKIKEILGEDMPSLMPATVVNASNTEVTYKQDPKNPASPEIKVPIKPGVVSVNPQTGDTVVNPNATQPNAPNPADALKPGAQVKVAAAPGAMSPNPTPTNGPSQAPAGTPPEQGGQQNTPTAENFGEEDPIANLEKEFKSLNEPLDEAAYIAKLAQRVAGVPVINKETKSKDILDLRALAGLR